MDNSDFLQSLPSLTDLFEKYVIENYPKELIEILNAEESKKHYGIKIKFILLFEKHVELGSSILFNPIKILPELDKKLITAQENILNSISNLEKENLHVKTKVHAHITGLPCCSEFLRFSFPRNQDIGRFLALSGTVTRITAPKMLEYQREYMCSSCKQCFIVEAEYDLSYTLQPPVKCLNCECTAISAMTFKATGKINYKDYQEIKIQEQVTKLNVGTVPQSMWATLEDDLVDSCKPGDDILFCGTIIRRWKSSIVGNEHDIELCIRVSDVSISNDQKTSALFCKEAVTKFQEFWNNNGINSLLARDMIIASMCPRVYGLYLVKLALAIVIAGGTVKHESIGQIRAEPHILLVGDPGTGKSHLMRFISKICPRSVLTTGVGSSSAGLTVSVVHEHGEWQLEAGALVLADGGICCVDEFNSIKIQDRAAIHEAMEQQTISIAKAGVVSKLSTRCSIVAATNPKGQYDPNLPLSVNISVASPLLSRFDIILFLLDSRNLGWDKTISDFILNEKELFDSNKKTTSLWKEDKLQEYFRVIKSFNPKLTEDANLVLCGYYQAKRKSVSQNQARTTVRLLESLIRLSQGHARIMFREEVIVMDAVIAIYLIECSVQDTPLVEDIDTLHASFPVDPFMEYKRQAQSILGKLGFEKILEKELKFIEMITRIQ